MPDNSQTITNQNLLWNELIKKENRPHLYHSLNNTWTDGTWKAECKPATPLGQGDFYSGSLSFLNQKYEGAAGVPSPLVEMAWRLDTPRQSSGLSPGLRSTSGVLAAAARMSSGPGTPRMVAGTPLLQDRRALCQTPNSQKSFSGRSINSERQSQIAEGRLFTPAR